MVGIDENWVESGTNRFANYAQLPPGHYTLQVAASSDGALWTAIPIELQITIRPPWYQTWWAYLFYLALILSLAYWLYTAQIRRVKLNEQLASKNREASRLLELDQIKTRFFANISHEFRTPLTLLIGPIEELKKESPKSPMLHMMERNAKRLLALINQLLDLGKLEARKMEVSLRKDDLVNFIQVIGSSFAPLAQQRQIAYQILQDRPAFITYFDTDKLEKIVTNLLSNAFKFTATGKSIELKVQYDEQFQQVTISVKDTGAGIAADKIGQVFERFYQTDSNTNRNHEGTGIGLALVKEMVQLLKGEVRVESELGIGSTFYIILPLINNAAADDIAESHTIEKSALDFAGLPDGLAEEGAGLPVHEKAQETPADILLIVEDNEDLRAYISSVLEKDYQILEAKNGREGFEKALETIPDIVISDLMMPVMDGFEFCKKLKSAEKTSHIPVVMLTAKGSMESRIEGLELGADDYLTKPFNADEIKARVGNLIKTREKLRQLYSQRIVELKPTEIKVSSMDEAFMEKAKAIVEKHLSESAFDMGRFADEMNMTAVQLRRKLKALTNYTSNEFVRKYRLERAAQLLAQKSATVSEIAFDVGFENLSYFSKMFQEEFGKLPSEA